VGNVLSIDFRLLLTKTKRKVLGLPETFAYLELLPEPTHLRPDHWKVVVFKKKIVDHRRPRCALSPNPFPHRPLIPPFLCVSKIFSAPPRLRDESPFLVRPILKI
jgi:hypothetical protein